MDFNRICIGCMREKRNRNAVCEFCGMRESDYRAPARALPVYTILHGRYLLGKVLGAGGFGITYIALDLTLEHVVAVKEFFLRNGMSRNHTRTNDVGFNGRGQADRRIYEFNRYQFEQEAKILASLSDLTGIVRVSDYFPENRTYYIVMEYLTGITLKEYVQRHGGRMSMENTMQFLNPVMTSLQQVHARNLLHRDISPDNMKFAGDEMMGVRLKLYDFGGARIGLGKLAGSSKAPIFRKPGFTPLEQLSGAEEQGPYTDVYAMAATIYYCICGRSPEGAKERRYGTARLTPPSQLGVRIPPEAEAVLQKALAIQPGERYPTIQEFQRALNLAVKKSGRRFWNRKDPKSRALTAAALIGMSAMFLAAGVIWWARPAKKDESTSADTGRGTAATAPEYAEADEPGKKEDVENTDPGSGKAAEQKANAEDEGTALEQGSAEITERTLQSDAIVENYNQARITYSEAEAQMENSSDPQGGLEQLEELKESKEAFRQGNVLLNGGNPEKEKEAIACLEQVIPEDINYNDAQTQIRKIRENRVALCQEEVELLTDNHQYEQALQVIVQAQEVAEDDPRLQQLASSTKDAYADYASDTAGKLALSGEKEAAEKLLEDAYQATGQTSLLEQKTELEKQEEPIHVVTGEAGFFKDDRVVPDTGYILPDTKNRVYSRSEIRELSHRGVRFAINEIYARNGYIFHEKQQVVDYFAKKTWYHGDTTDMSVASARMNKNERDNIDLLLEIENSDWGGEYQLS